LNYTIFINKEASRDCRKFFIHDTTRNFQ
jgi:hypothetical protein